SRPSSFPLQHEYGQDRAERIGCCIASDEVCTCARWSWGNGGRREMATRSWVALASLPVWLTVACSDGEPPFAGALRPQIEQLRQTLLAPAAVVLIRSWDLGDWTATFGTRARMGTEPITANDHVRIGSCTKTWTG